MAVVLLMTNGPEARRASFLRWLSLLGHHGLDVRTVEEARLTLGCVRASLVVVDAGSEEEPGPDPVGWGDDGEDPMTEGERAALALLDGCVNADGSRPTVFVVGARARAYRHFRTKLAVRDRFLDVPAESDVAKEAIIELLTEPERISKMWALPERAGHASSN